MLNIVLKKTQLFAGQNQIAIYLKLVQSKKYLHLFLFSC